MAHVPAAAWCGMALTDAQLLTATREAIDALTTGGLSSYALNGRTYTMVDLDALWKQVSLLERRIASSASSRRFALLVTRGG